MWSGEQRELLDCVLDQLIPASTDGRVPAAGAIGVADFLSQATSYAWDPAGAVNTVLTCISDKAPAFAALDPADRVAVLKQVEQQESEAFATLVRLTYMGYYSRSDIRPLFGVGAHPVHPGGYPVPREDDELMETLVAPVRNRGEVYRR